MQSFPLAGECDRISARFVVAWGYLSRKVVFLHMMLTLRSYVGQGRRLLTKWLSDPRTHLFLRAAAWVLAGFILSAASLGNRGLPLCMGLVLATGGWSAVLVTLGGIMGFPLLWGAAGYQGLCWLAVALPATLLLGTEKATRRTPYLLPALGTLIVAATGVAFQSWLQDTTPVGLYLLRVALGGITPWLFRRVLQGRNPLLEWVSCGFLVLGLAQLAPLPQLNLGLVAAGALAVVGTFPATILAGLALDLSGICPVPLTAALCGAYLVRFLPRYPRWLGGAAPALSYVLVGSLSGAVSFSAFPALLAGGILGLFLPQPTKLAHRRGETGMAQVRLEMVASVLAQTEQLLLEAPTLPIDEDALVTRAAEQACSGCPCRKHCPDAGRIAQLTGVLLHKPLLTPSELPIVCRKSGRFLAQLHRSQEQLRTIQADRQRQREYRAAVVQQYGFLSEYLQELSDGLTRRPEENTPAYTPNISVYANRSAAANGDRCARFAGTRGRYYVLLCDGMGSGIGAVQEGKTATALLQRLLTAGYPAKYALQSLNSLCALRSQAGIVTVELLELQLDTGRAALYKWGAAPSYLVSPYGAEKIGTAGPPPGLSVTESREAAHQLSLRRGECLLLVSDGVPQEAVLRCCLEGKELSTGQLARQLLGLSQPEGEDDATVVTVSLERAAYEQ